MSWLLNFQSLGKRKQRYMVKCLTIILSSLISSLSFSWYTAFTRSTGAYVYHLFEVTRIKYKKDTNTIGFWISLEMFQSHRLTKSDMKLFLDSWDLLDIDRYFLIGYFMDFILFSKSINFTYCMLEFFKRLFIHLESFRSFSLLFSSYRLAQWITVCTIFRNCPNCDSDISVILHYSVCQRCYCCIQWYIC